MRSTMIQRNRSPVLGALLAAAWLVALTTDVALARPIDESRPAAEDVRITVENINGTITVEGWSKKDAIKEMREGGFSFHEIWRNLPEWIESLDIDEIKRQAGMEPDKEPADP